MEQSLWYGNLNKGKFKEELVINSYLTFIYH